MTRIVSVLAMVIVVFAGATRPAVAEDDRQIRVTGEGQIAARPDMATITLGVTRANAEARVAMDQVSEAMRIILTQVEAQGIAEKDVQTSRLSLNPIWSDRRASNPSAPTITGFSASNMVTIRVRDMTRLGDVLDQLLHDGANQFQGLEFGLQDPKPALEAARKAAVADAMGRARLLADAAGVTLGAIQVISDSVVAAPQPYMMREAAAIVGDAMPVAAGEVTTGATVSMIFAIGD